MSSIDAVAGGNSPTSTGFSSLSSDEFTKLILTELSNQDPLEPNDTGALLDQLANIRSIQSDIDLSDNLSELVSQNQLASSAGLIGQIVSGVSETRERTIGEVLSVSRTETGAVLNLDNGQRVPMNSVDEIVGSDLFDDPGDTP